MSQMTPQQIKAALDAGIIDAAQAADMLAAAPQAPLSPPRNPQTEIQAEITETDSVIGNEDDMRFMRSFSDVFIAIGIALFALGLSALAVMLGGGVSFIAAALVMAGLAEYFGKRKRQHLPTLITALAFLIFMQRGLGVVLGDLGWGGAVPAAAVTFVAMFMFYLRVRLPFCIALMAISILYLFFTVLTEFAPDLMRHHTGWMLMLGGLVTLIVAMRYDMEDVHRTTRFSDNAFWLHFTAAPLIIHGGALEMVKINSQRLFDILPVPMLDKGGAGLLMLMVLGVALFGLAINRRALIVSSLGYAGFAIAFLMSGTGLGFGKITAFTLLLLGAAIIFLGTGWHPARNAMLRILPDWRIFPPPFKADYNIK